MVLGVKTRLMLAGAAAAAALLALSTANAQMDPTGSPTTPGIQPTTPQPLPDFNTGGDAGMGGSGFSPPASVPSPFGDDAGIGGSGLGGSGFTPPSAFGGQDAGFGY
jgi:hypothetical protein